MFLAKLIGKFGPAVFVKLFEMAFVFGVDDPGVDSPLDNEIWDQAIETSRLRSFPANGDERLVHTARPNLGTDAARPEAEPGARPSARRARAWVSSRPARRSGPFQPGRAHRRAKPELASLFGARRKVSCSSKEYRPTGPCSGRSLLRQRVLRESSAANSAKQRAIGSMATHPASERLTTSIPQRIIPRKRRSGPRSGNRQGNSWNLPTLNCSFW